MTSARQQYEAAVQEVVLELSRAVLHSPQLDEFHQSPAALYHFLGEYFTLLAEQQLRQKELSISKQDVHTLLRDILTPKLRLTAATGLNTKKAASLDNLPFVAIRELREQLSSLRINVAGLSEVVELTRCVERLAPSVTAAPLGSVNLMYFAAIFVTLCPVDTLAELIEVIVDSKDVNNEQKLRIFNIWSLLDEPNRTALDDLTRKLQDTPGMTMPLLRELFPQVQDIHTERYQSPAAVGGSSRTTVMAVHSADDGPSVVEGADASSDCPRSDSDEEECEGDMRTDEDRQFWKDLVS